MNALIPLCETHTRVSIIVKLLVILLQYTIRTGSSLKVTMAVHQSQSLPVVMVVQLPVQLLHPCPKEKVFHLVDCKH